VDRNIVYAMSQSQLLGSVTRSLAKSVSQSVTHSLTLKLTYFFIWSVLARTEQNSENQEE
jgi:hypothetical protein